MLEVAIFSGPSGRQRSTAAQPRSAVLRGGRPPSSAWASTFWGSTPIDALFYTAVINGLLAPPLLVLIMLAANHKKIVGNRTNNYWTNFAGWAATAVMSLAAVVLVITWGSPPAVS